MANEYRSPLDYRFGTLSVAAALSDTTLQSVAFASLGTGYSTSTYLPIVLHDPATGAYEVCWVTAHTASSTSVTVVRGKEGTAAAAWAASTQWICAPTQRDGQLVTTRAGLPSDAHHGLRAVLTDEAVPVVYSNGGWAVPVGGSGTGRKHGWRQTGSTLASSSTPALITGWIADTGNASIATMDTGVLTLNKAGLWSLAARAFSDLGLASTDRAYQKLLVNWPNGAFGPQPWTDMATTGTRAAAVPGGGQCDTPVTWTGYVSSSAATQGIRVYVEQANSAGAAVTNFGYYLIVEYLGG